MSFSNFRTSYGLHIGVGIALALTSNAVLAEEHSQGGEIEIIFTSSDYDFSENYVSDRSDVRDLERSLRDLERIGARLERDAQTAIGFTELNAAVATRILTGLAHATLFPNIVEDAIYTPRALPSDVSAISICNQMESRLNGKSAGALLPQTFNDLWKTGSVKIKFEPVNGSFTALGTTVRATVDHAEGSVYGMRPEALAKLEKAFSKHPNIQVKNVIYSPRSSGKLLGIPKRGLATASAVGKELIPLAIAVDGAMNLVNCSHSLLGIFAPSIFARNDEEDYSAAIANNEEVLAKQDLSDAIAEQVAAASQAQSAK